MKRFLQNVAATLVAMVGLSALAVPVFVSTTAVADTQTAVCTGINSTLDAPRKTCDTTTLSTRLKQVINILLFIIGTIAVIMIIVGGIRYVTSGGDQAQITSAKNTVLYSIVGVVVAVMAYALVNFVVGAF